MFSCGSVLWSSENTASSLMMQTNLMQNFSVLLNHTCNFFWRVNVFADKDPMVRGALPLTIWSREKNRVPLTIRDPPNWQGPYEYEGSCEHQGPSDNQGPF